MSKLSSNGLASSIRTLSTYSQKTCGLSSANAKYHKTTFRLYPPPLQSTREKKAPFAKERGLPQGGKGVWTWASSKPINNGGIDTHRTVIICQRHGRRNAQALHRVKGKRTFSSRTGHGSAAIDEVDPIQSHQNYTISKEESRGLVDTYDSLEADPIEKDIPKPFTNGSRPTTRHVRPTAVFQETEETRLVVAELSQLLDSEETPHHHIYNTYLRLPEPRATYVPRDVLDKLVHHLSVTEYKSHTGMIRFLSLVSDMKSVGIPLTRVQWNTSIAFAGRCMKKVSSVQVDHALQLWREMTGEAGIEADHVTLGILYDVATKAGRFALADMIHNEISARGLPLTRFFRTGLIYHYGLRKDSANVRKAYVELIESGEVVDTSVINSVIAALLRCDEAVAAEQVFERMKRLHFDKTNQNLPPPHWRENRALGRTLNEAEEAVRLAGGLDATPETDTVSSPAHQELARLREITSVAPNLTTYKLLIRYHAIVAGDIDRVAQLADEMEEFRISVHGVIFLHLFRAFALYGGIPYSQWTRARLENTWSAFVAALDDAQQAREEEAYQRRMDSMAASSSESEHRNLDENQGVESVEQERQGWPSFFSYDTEPTVEHEQPFDGEHSLDSPLSEGARLEDASSTRSHETVYLSIAAVSIICRAFAKCSNISRTAEVFVELKAKWQLATRPDEIEVWEDKVEQAEDQIAALFKDDEQLFRDFVEERESRSVLLDAFRLDGE